MHSFEYRNDQLFCEDVSLNSLADAHGTPLYVYSAGTICDHFQRLDQAMSPVDHLICFAVKANSNIAVLNLLAKQGAGFDIVSGGELFRVIQAGGDPAKCSFAGVGKTRQEIEYALEQGIHSFNVESEEELRFIDKVAGEVGKKAPISMRVNPNVDAKTHKYISTGKSENKFGIDFDIIRDVYARAHSELKNIELRGLQMHIGSQLTSIDPFIEAVKKVAPVAAEFKEAYGIEFFSIGGGIGIVYQNSLASGPSSYWEGDDAALPLTVTRYAEALLPILQPLGLRIMLEPGRFIVGNAGVLLTEVLYEKKGKAKTFKIVDAGMNDLIRPALYEGHHEIVPLEKIAGAETITADIVGPICESGDFFGQNREITDVQVGQRIALMSAGAYGFVMASNYNTRPLPAEILVDGDKSSIIRQRQTLKDLLAGESIPGA